MKGALHASMLATPGQPVKATVDIEEEPDVSEAVMLQYDSDDEYIPNLYDRNKNRLISNDTKTRLEMLEILEHFKENLPSDKSAKAKFSVTTLLNENIK